MIQEETGSNANARAFSLWARIAVKRSERAEATYILHHRDSRESRGDPEFSLLSAAISVVNGLCSRCQLPVSISDADGFITR